MRAKVEESLAMVQAEPQLEIVICSGMQRGSLAAALAGERVGTLIHA
jgi:isopentenyl phosphate kinase